MKIKDLKLGQEITINGHQYKYLGVNTVRVPMIGRVQKVVFENKIIGDKHFDFKVMNQELKEKDGLLIYKP